MFFIYGERKIVKLSNCPLLLVIIKISPIPTLWQTFIILNSGLILYYVICYFSVKCLIYFQHSVLRCSHAGMKYLNSSHACYFLKKYFLNYFLVNICNCKYIILIYFMVIILLKLNFYFFLPQIVFFRSFRKYLWNIINNAVQYAIF